MTGQRKPPGFRGTYVWWGQAVAVYIGGMEDFDDFDDEELEAYLRKYMKRTGIFRMYLVDREAKTTRLLLEAAIRGKPLFTIPLWVRKTGYPF
jgi:hypothetical protein